MFEGPRDLVKQYASLAEGNQRVNRVALGEILRILDQLDLAIAMVSERSRQTSEAFAAAGTDESLLKEAAARTHHLHDESQLLAEAFYYFGFAIVTLIRREQLPYVGRLNAKDIAVIRNQLLAHYRPDPAAPFGRVGTSGESSGPAFVKYSRDAKGGLRTGGLFEDAEAFSRVLWDLFTDVLGRARLEGGHDD